MYNPDKMEKLFIIIVFCSFSYFAKAQDKTTNFNQQELKEFERQVVGDVRNFCNYLGDLASNNTPKENKPQIKKNLLSLFINSATMEVLSVSRPKSPRTYPINTYLDIVSNYSGKYKFIALQFYKVVVDSKNLRDTVVKGQKMYVGRYSYWQRFLASNLNKETNEYTQEDFTKGGSDETMKTGVFYIISRDTKLTTTSNGGKKWYVLLGDIKAKEIKPI